MEKISLKQILFMNQFNIKITPIMCQNIIKIIQRYEIRGENMIAFNEPYLAVHKAYFLPKDAEAVFDCFGIYEADFARECKKCSAISASWNVTGNDFNILIAWLVYLLGKTSGLPVKLINDTRFYLIKLLLYKFFTGKVAVMFKHGANEGIMQYTIDNLSAKSDIKKPETNTWRLLIEQHAREALAPDSVHAAFLDTFTPDDKLVYFLSDLHTRLSSKIKNVAEEYYKNHQEGNTITTTSIISKDEDGEKVLGELKATLDNVIIQIQQTCLNPTAFINYNHLKLAGELANTRPELLKKTLLFFSDSAQQQYKAHQGDEIMITKKKEQIYIGYRILIKELIQKCYRRAALNGADMNSNVEILKKISDAIRASRIQEESILLIKNSVDYFIEQNMHIQREATYVALRTSFILYIIILTFNKR